MLNNSATLNKLPQNIVRPNLGNVTLPKPGQLGQGQLGGIKLQDLKLPQNKLPINKLPMSATLSI